MPSAAIANAVKRVVAYSNAAMLACGAVLAFSKCGSCYACKNILQQFKSAADRANR